MNYTELKNDAKEFLDAFKVFELKNGYGILEPAAPELESAFHQINNGLIFMIHWATSKEGEVVTPNDPELALMKEFLGKLKALFEEYSASIEYADGAGFVRVARGDVDAQHIIPMYDDLLISGDFVIEDVGTTEGEV